MAGTNPQGPRNQEIEETGVEEPSDLPRSPSKVRQKQKKETGKGRAGPKILGRKKTREWQDHECVRDRIVVERACALGKNE